MAEQGEQFAAVVTRPRLFRVEDRVGVGAEPPGTCPFAVPEPTEDSDGVVDCPLRQCPRQALAADEASAADGRGVLAGETREAWKRSHCRALLVQSAAASMIAFVESRPIVRPVAR